MGHQSNEARKALRAYAHNLQTTAHRGGLVSSVGASKQDDASVQFSGSGAPHQLAMAAAAVCVVLLGGIGFAAATSSTPPAQSEQANSVSAQPESFTAVFARTGSIPTSQAIQAFSDLGMTRTVEALRAAADAGVDSSESVTDALSNLVEVVGRKLKTKGTVAESDLDVALAVAGLELAVPPPGLNPLWTPPGHGGEPPGQDPDFPNFVPPGQDSDREPGSDSAPGQTKEPNPNKGSGNNSGEGKP